MLSKVGLCVDNINWWFRLWIKIALLSLRLPYYLFQKIGIFRHGAMDQKDYVERIWKLHFNDVSELYDIRTSGSFLELGPGDSLITALKAKLVGFDHSILVDTNDFASDKKEILKELSDLNRAHFLKGSPANFRCEYLIEGKKSLREIEADLLSYAFSNSVLQHVDLEEVEDVLQELFRISSNGCIQSHVIDLRDMICRSSKHYQCPSWLWEAKFFRKFPIYTNRLRFSRWVELFTNTGFELIDVKIYDDFAQALDTGINFFDSNNVIANIHLVVRKN